MEPMETKFLVGQGIDFGICPTRTQGRATDISHRILILQGPRTSFIRGVLGIPISIRSQFTHLKFGH